jgi:paraquat-inducible protein B
MTRMNTDAPEDRREEEQTVGRTDAAPDAAVESTRGLPLVWLIPLVALVLGGWLAYKTLSEQGPTIRIAFKEAPGLEAGKSKIKYKDIEVGLIESVVLSDDLSQVIVTAKMEKHVATHLGERTAFWIVKPQLGLSGVSGLDTLMAGNYISVEFAEGKAHRSFTGLEQPPRISAGTPGKAFTLAMDAAGALKYGTPIYFRDIQVGQAVDVRLSDDHQTVQTEIFIDAPYDQLIRDNTRFWRINAIDLSMGAEGVNLKIGSIVTLLGGGITFETPNLNDPGNPPSVPGKRFWLHKDFSSIAEGSYTIRHAYLIYFDDSVRGLSVGAPVEIKGIRIGTVTDIKFDLDLVSRKVRIPVLVEFDPERPVPYGAEDQVRRFVADHAADLASGRHPAMEALVENGLRARLKTGNLLTGQLYVDVDFYSSEPPAKLKYGGKYPEIPSLPSVAAELQKDLTEIVASLKKLPLDRIGQELLGTVQGTNRLTNAPEWKETIRSLDAALKDSRQLMQTADKQLSTLTASVEKSLGSAVKVLEQIEPNAPMAVDIGNALEELAVAARSIRVLSDYLERHPESLLYGKGGHGAKK